MRATSTVSAVEVSRYLGGLPRLAGRVHDRSISPGVVSAANPCVSGRDSSALACSCEATSASLGARSDRVSMDAAMWNLDHAGGPASRPIVLARPVRENGTMGTAVLRRLLLALAALALPFFSFAARGVAQAGVAETTFAWFEEPGGRHRTYEFRERRIVGVRRGLFVACQGARS